MKRGDRRMLVHDLGPNGRDIVTIVDPPRNGKVLVRFPSGATLTVQEHHLTATPTARRTHRTHDLPTAIDAARATTPTLGHTQWQVLDALAHAAEQGLIDAEHEAITGAPTAATFTFSDTVTTSTTTLIDITDAPTPARKKRAKNPKPGPTRPSPASKRVRCPECGDTVGSNAGLAIHRKHRHGVTPKNSTTTADLRPPRPDPDAGAQLVGPMVLRCACGHDARSLRALVAHTSDAHDRMPTTTERTPVRSDPEDAA
jgi:hypothetical protein